MGEDTCSLGFLSLNEVIPFVSSDVGVVLGVVALVYIIVSVVVMGLIHHEAAAARKGNSDAAELTIFPIFVAMMWASAFSDLLVGLALLFFPVEPRGANSLESSIIFGGAWGVQHFVLEGIAVMLLQYGCGVSAAKDAMVYAGVWAAFTWILEAVSYYTSSAALAYGLQSAWMALVLFFYGGMWLLPRQVLFRRPAGIFYARFWFCFRMVAVIVDLLRALPPTRDVGQCMLLAPFFIFAVCKPVVLYMTFVRDSEWWQGLAIPGESSETNTAGNAAASSSVMSVGSYAQPGFSPAPQPGGVGGPGGGLGGLRTPGAQTAGSENNGTPAGTAEFSDIKEPLLGVEVGLRDAQDLAAYVDRMRRRVRLLNFAFISLDRTRLLGQGSSSKVYLGTYRERLCAVKLLFTLDLTKEVIKRAYKEATLLSQFRHPNIVRIIGVAVLPPSVCTVLEYCFWGSLRDVIDGRGPSSQDPYTRSSAGSGSSFGRNSFGRASFGIGGGSSGGERESSRGSGGRHSGRGSSGSGYMPDTMVGLSWEDKLFLALGCARGLAALHQVPNLVHRDIKSFNFLVDSQFNAKLADLELGRERDRSFASDITKSGSGAALDSPHASRSAAAAAAAAAEGEATAAEAAAAANDLEAGGGHNSHNRGTRRPPLSWRSQQQGKHDRALSAESDPDDPDFTDDVLANWTAPEVLKGEPSTQASDVYSLGLVLWELVSEKIPYEDAGLQSRIVQLIVSGHPPYLPRNCPPDFADLIRRCLAFTPADRPTAAAVADELFIMWRTHSLLSLLPCISKHTLVAHFPEAAAAAATANASAAAAAAASEELTPAQLGRRASEPQRPAQRFRGQRHAATSQETKKEQEEEEGTSGRAADGADRTRRARASTESYAEEPAEEEEKMMSRLAALRNAPEWEVLEASRKPFVVTTATYPFRCIYVTKAWSRATGYGNEELLGRTFNCLHGEYTDHSVLRRLAKNILKHRLGHCVVVNYRKDGSAFYNSLHVLPLCDDMGGGPHCFVALMSVVGSFIPPVGEVGPLPMSTVPMSIGEYLCTRCCGCCSGSGSGASSLPPEALHGIDAPFRTQTGGHPALSTASQSHHGASTTDGEARVAQCASCVHWFRSMRACCFSCMESSPDDEFDFDEDDDESDLGSWAASREAAGMSTVTSPQYAAVAR